MAKAKRKWRTSLTAKGKTPQAALTKLQKDPLAMLITSTIYLRPVYEHGLESLVKPDTDRRILTWEAVTEITYLGEIDG